MDKEVKIIAKDVMLWAGAGQIGMAIARRMGAGMKIIVGDKNPENAASIDEFNGPAAISIKICSPSAPPDAPGQPMR